MNSVAVALGWVSISEKLHELFIADTKLNISSAYLRPGSAFGGACLPKDLRALQSLASDLALDVPLIQSVMRSNELHKDFVAADCLRRLRSGDAVLMVGLAFKADSDDFRESPYVDLASRLIAAGIRLSIYDPNVDPSRLIGQNREDIRTRLPSLETIMVSELQVRGATYDAIIDANGRASRLSVSAPVRISLDRLDRH